MNNNKKKGQVIFVNIYENTYYNVFLDGVFIALISKEYFTNFLFRRKNRKEIAEIAKLKEDELRYTLIDMYFHVKNYNNYDSNDYEDYNDVIKFCKENNVPKEFENVDLDYIEENY